MTQMKDHVGYLEACLKRCQTRPDLNQAQMEAYQKYLEMAGSASSPEEYADQVKASGMYEIARAESLDRFRNRAELYRKLGDLGSAEAWQAGFEALSKASNHEEVNNEVSRTTEAVTASAPARGAARDAVEGLFTSLLDWAMQQNPEAKATHLAMVRHHWSMIHKGDPACTWERLVSHPPYRNRIPFSGARLGVIEGWFRKAVA